MDIKEYRQQIDQIDTQLINLFAERMEVAAGIAEYKRNNGLPVLDPKREEEKILDVISKTPDGFKDYTPILFNMLFELSRSYQTRLNGSDATLVRNIQDAVLNTPKMIPDNVTVACQGIEGANSQAACNKLFRYPKTKFYPTFKSVFTAVESGECQYGIVPLENSNAGSVTATYDLMMKHNFYIASSIRLKINHNLLVKPGTKLSDIKEIYSHQQAIAQCSEFLSTLPDVRVIPAENTAVAAKTVAESERGDIAALASEICLKYYGLECLKANVQNVDNNYTRFICITKNLEIFPGANRTSLMAALKHEPGALYNLLCKFYSHGINLIKLESRPLPNRDFEFMFYFDLDTSIYSSNLLDLLGELPTACETFQYLGSYSEVI